MSYLTDAEEESIQPLRKRFFQGNDKIVACDDWENVVFAGERCFGCGEYYEVHSCGGVDRNGMFYCRTCHNRRWGVVKQERRTAKAMMMPGTR